MTNPFNNLVLFVEYSFPPWLYVVLHSSHGRSKLSSPSFSSATFQNFAGISGLTSEVPQSQHQTKLCSTCVNALASSLHVSSSLLVKRIFFLNAAFAMTVLDSISRVHLASFVITLPNSSNRREKMWRIDVNGSICIFVCEIWDCHVGENQGYGSSAIWRRASDLKMKAAGSPETLSRFCDVIGSEPRRFQS